MKKDKKQNEYLIIILFLAFLLLLPVSWKVIKVASPTAFEKINEELNENRNLTSFDINSLWSSGDNINQFINDRAPYRNVLIKTFQKYNQKGETATGKLISLCVNIFKPSAKDKQQLTVTDLGNLYSDNTPSASVNESVSPTPEPEVGHSHDYKLIDSIPCTCTENGKNTYFCEGCDSTYEEEVPATRHNGELIVSSSASYTTYGYDEYKCAVCGATYRENIEPKLIDADYLAPNYHGEGAIKGKYNWVFLASYGNLPYYTATNILTEEEMSEYADKVQKLQDICDEKEITLALMFMPNKDQVYSEYMPSYKIEDEYKRTARLADYLNENTSTDVVYPLETMKAADFYWQTYYKYDTHWNHAGSFIGLQELYRAIGDKAGVEMSNPLQVPGTLTTVIGHHDLIDLGGLDLNSYPEDHDFIFDYKPEIEVNGVDLIKNVIRTTSTSQNDKKMVMLSDSYRIMLIPYITKDFSSCAIAHRDYMGSLEKDIKECNVLILTAVERYDKRIFPVIDKLIDLLK